MFCFCDAFCVELIPITAVYCSDQGELSLASFFALSIINRISDRMGDIESIRVIYSIVSELTEAKRRNEKHENVKVSTCEEEDGGADGSSKDPIPSPPEKHVNRSSEEKPGEATASVPVTPAFQQSPDGSNGDPSEDVSSPSASEGQEPAVATSVEQNHCISPKEKASQKQESEDECRV